MPAAFARTKARTRPAPKWQRPPGTAVHPAIGNEAFLPSRRLEPACPCGGGCPHCRASAASASRLAIGAPGDRFEQEAEQVAEQVLHMPEPMPAGRPEVRQSAPPQIGLLGRSPGELIQRDMRDPYAIEEGSSEESQSTGMVQTQAQPGHTPQLSPEFEHQIGSLQGGGQPLAGPVRRSMESRFGHDFSRVRIHTHETAAALAASINARAFALGRDLVFGAGQYAPESEAGRRLIAHELTHAVQQGHAPRLGVASAGSDRNIGPCDATPHSPNPGISAAPAGARTIRCVRWNPNVDTGKKVKPWGTGPDGRILRASTDAGTPLDIWKPDDGQTYWCHGFTFGGSTAAGGPYSFWGSDVPTVLRDDGWSPQTDSCAAKSSDILVFQGDNPITHSGVIRSVSGAGGGVDEDASTLESKWGSGSLNTSSWARNTVYGQYRCFSKSPAFGACKYRGINETGTPLPLPPGDYPAPTGDTRLA